MVHLKCYTLYIAVIGINERVLFKQPSHIEKDDELDELNTNDGWLENVIL